jgi:hypothetical protein
LGGNWGFLYVGSGDIIQETYNLEVEVRPSALQDAVSRC